MADKQARVRVTGGFSPGTKVGLAPRYGDRFNIRTARAVDTQTVDAASTVEFTGLPEGERFWIYSIDQDDRRALAAVAKTEQPGKQRLTDTEIRDRLAQTAAPNRLQRGNTVTNPATRTKTVTQFAGGLDAHESVGGQTKAADRELEPQPRLRQEDARNVPQRSATLTGSAHPVEAGEPQPRPRQEDFQEVPQRSATPAGEATPILVKPETQEDARRLHQRSATEEGEAVPKPEGDPVHQSLTRDASVVQAATEQRDEPEPASKAGDQRKKRPVQSGVKKASQKASETAQASRKDAGQRAALRKQADKQSDN
jgi:hypothetical protein